MLWAKITMKFGEYFKQRRKRLKITQENFPGYSQSYISNIERGINNPTQRELIENLAHALRFPPEKVDWLWMYSLLNREPCEYLLSKKTMTVNEHEARYYTTEVAIDLGSTEEDVLAAMGPPNKRMRIPSQTKWIYQHEGVHVIFSDGKVVEVMFK